MHDRDKKDIILDFDGVIHTYERGWQEGVIYGDVVPGFFEWAQNASVHFILNVFSTRSAVESTRNEMEAWMKQKWHRWLILSDKEVKNRPFPFRFPDRKPPAVLSIDDRAIQFRGDWGAWWLQPEQLKKFAPWTTGAPSSCGVAPADDPAVLRGLLKKIIALNCTGDQVLKLDVITQDEAEIVKAIICEVEPQAFTGMDVGLT